MKCNETSFVGIVLTVQGMAGLGRAGHGSAGHGRAGQGRVGQGGGIPNSDLRKLRMNPGRVCACVRV